MRQRTIRHRLIGWTEPAAAFEALHGTSENAFWLDGGVGAVSGRSYVGASSSVATSSVADGTVTLSPSGRVLDGSILGFLRSRLPSTGEAPVGTNADVGRDADPDADPDAVGVPLGWVGWLGYELRAQTMSAPSGRVRAREAPRPDAAFLEVDRLVCFDHAAGVVELVALGDSWTGELCAWRDHTAAALGAAGRSAATVSPDRPSAGPRLAGSGIAAIWFDSDEEYLAKIAACQHAIQEGEAYQLCLTTQVAVDTRPDPLATWLRLRAASPSHHGGFLRIGGVSLLSSSPEQFLSLDAHGVLESKPIKGTRARGETAGDDERLRAELMASEKERAENLMIVDLMRNDLGRVCELGSVTVPSLLQVESYAQVHQLVSRVRGILAPGRHPVDAIEACFPAGSMTGAPKLRATEILDALEGRARGLYAGAFGYVGFDGTLDLAMVIRSIVLDADGASIGAGGGITSSSVPGEELAEVKLKAAALLAVLGAAAE